MVTYQHVKQWIAETRPLLTASTAPQGFSAGVHRRWFLHAPHTILLDSTPHSLKYAHTTHLHPIPSRCCREDCQHQWSTKPKQHSSRNNQKENAITLISGTGPPNHSTVYNTVILLITSCLSVTWSHDNSSPNDICDLALSCTPLTQVRACDK